MSVEFVLRVLGSALVLGVLGDVLLRVDQWGLNVVLGTTALVVVAATLLPRERSGTRAGRLLLLLPPVFAVGVAWRSAPLLSAWNLLAVAGTLALPVMRTGGVRLPTGRPLDYVVRTNVARAQAGAELDAHYLASLSADAVPALVLALPDLPDAAACIVLEALTPHEGSAERRDWRGWHMARARARDAATGLAAARAARCTVEDGTVP